MSFFEAPQMAVRRMLLPSTAMADLPPYQPHRWPGPPAQAPTFWNSHIRTTAFLKSFGFPSENIAIILTRADNREFTQFKQRQAVTASTKFNGGSDTRAIPAVFVPTSLANNYNSISTF